MPKFSDRSKNKLNECDETLIITFNEVIKYYDHSVLCGFRNETTQNLKVEEKRSKVKWPYSQHNTNPSMAVDVAPYPYSPNNDWKNLRRHYYLAGLVIGISKELFSKGRIKSLIGWGGDWDKDTDFSDQKFNDLEHYFVIRSKS